MSKNGVRFTVRVPIYINVHGESDNMSKDDLRDRIRIDLPHTLKTRMEALSGEIGCCDDDHDFMYDFKAKYYGENYKGDTINLGRVAYTDPNGKDHFHFLDDYQSAQEFAAALPSTCKVTAINACYIPKAMHEYIGAWLAKESDQFVDLDRDGQLNEIYLCYRQLEGAMYEFKDSRYAY